MSLPPRPRTARRVFIDTSAFFALTAPRDAHHQTAIMIRDRLIAEHWHPFTSNLVSAETQALVLTRLGRSIARRVLEDIDRGTATIVRVNLVDERRAREILTQYDDKDFSLTDATSFALMERLAIPYAFTFDRNFAQYGLTVLTAN